MLLQAVVSCTTLWRRLAWQAITTRYLMCICVRLQRSCIGNAIACTC